MLIRRTAAAVTLGLAAAFTMAPVVAAWSSAAWAPATSAESIPGTSAALNTAALEGCPFVAQRGDVLYFASNRPGGLGGLDIWYALRIADGGWGEPVNFTIVNSSVDDFCPMAHRNGRTFLFVSARAGGCGGDDIYASRLHETRGWAAPTNLGCAVNSAGNEASPSLTDTELYFSSTRAGGPGGSDIYRSAFDGTSFGPPAIVAELSTSANDNRPNLRRDGLEVYFDSNRSGGLGGIDIWSATRMTTAEAWSTPTNLGANVNSGANDLRASLSWDGTTLYFGSTRAGEGSQDLLVTYR